MSARILNVDDNHANQYIKSRVLRGAGFEVLEADTGKGALSLARENLPDLVLLDVRLPDISGLDVCRELRADPRTQAIPIIHISATHVTRQDEQRSLSAGADLYLAEPVGAQELSSAVNALLRLRNTEQGLAASEERLRLATEGAGVATWEIDLGSGKAQWSGRFNAMLGYDTPVPASYSSWLERVHPEDRAAFEAAFAAAGKGQREFSHEHRVAVPGSSERWIAAFGRLYAHGVHAQQLIGIAVDISARKRSEREREALLAESQEARRIAEAAVRVKDEFLAVLSHEMRTPMSAMLGWLHLLKTGKLGAEQRITALETIERNVRVQNQLVNDLLDVSRIVTGKMDLESAPIQLDRALENALDSARLAGHARNIELVAHVERGSWTVQGNSERLQQVFSNLLSNAIKFSPKGSRVDVRLEGAGDEVRIEVADRGEGIVPELLEHVFDRFWQADSSMRRRHGGLGLGLAIVRSLVELHGGRVSAASGGKGQGATFAVTLPLAREAPAGAQPTPGDPLEADLRGIRLLVVDDDEGNLQMTAQVLRVHGASVMISRDAAGAQATAREWDPDLLVLDIGMPDIDGYQLLELLRAAVGRRVPAIALSGFASREDFQRSSEAGFQAHVAKPFDPPGFCHVVAQHAPRGSVAPA